MAEKVLMLDIFEKTDAVTKTSQKILDNFLALENNNLSKD